MTGSPSGTRCSHFAFMRLDRHSGVEPPLSARRQAVRGVEGESESP